MFSELPFRNFYRVTFMTLSNIYNENFYETHCDFVKSMFLAFNAFKGYKCPNTALTLNGDLLLLR